MIAPNNSNPPPTYLNREGNRTLASTLGKALRDVELLVTLLLIVARVSVRRFFRLLIVGKTGQSGCNLGFLRGHCC